MGKGSIFMSQSVERVSEDLNVLRGSEDLNFTQSLRCNSSSMPSGSRGCLVQPCVGAYWNQRLRDAKTSEGALNRIVSNISSATASALEIDLVLNPVAAPVAGMDALVKPAAATDGWCSSGKSPPPFPSPFFFREHKCNGFQVAASALAHFECGAVEAIWGGGGAVPQSVQWMG